MKYIIELFNKHAENTEFNEIENPLHEDKEICGLLYLRKLVKTDLNFVVSHSNLYLSEDRDLINKITEVDVIYLTRCGISFGGGYFYIAT